jgi:hypothetical protein
VSCTFCIVALPPAMENLEPLVKKALALPPPVKVLDTETVSFWRGSSTALGRSVPITITLYKAARRCRIQLISHELSEEERTRLEDAITTTLKATVVSRHAASGAHPVPSPLQAAVEHRTGSWPAWLPPPGFEPHSGAYRIDGGDAAEGEPGTYEVEESPG